MEENLDDDCSRASLDLYIETLEENHRQNSLQMQPSLFRQRSLSDSMDLYADLDTEEEKTKVVCAKVISKEVRVPENSEKFIDAKEDFHQIPKPGNYVGAKAGPQKNHSSEKCARGNISIQKKQAKGDLEQNENQKNKAWWISAHHELEERYAELVEKYATLNKNMMSLCVTARNEIRKKDSVISQLRKALTASKAQLLPVRVSATRVTTGTSAKNYSSSIVKDRSQQDIGDGEAAISVVASSGDGEVVQAVPQSKRGGQMPAPEGPTSQSPVVQPQCGLKSLPGHKLQHHDVPAVQHVSVRSSQPSQSPHGSQSPDGLPLVSESDLSSVKMVEDFSSVHMTCRLLPSQNLPQIESPREQESAGLLQVGKSSDRPQSLSRPLVITGLAGLAADASDCVTPDHFPSSGRSVNLPSLASSLHSDLVQKSTSLGLSHDSQAQESSSDPLTPGSTQDSPACGPPYDPPSGSSYDSASDSLYELPSLSSSRNTSLELPHASKYLESSLQKPFQSPPSSQSCHGSHLPRPAKDLKLSVDSQLLPLGNGVAVDSQLSCNSLASQDELPDVKMSVDLSRATSACHVIQQNVVPTRLGVKPAVGEVDAEHSVHAKDSDHTSESCLGSLPVQHKTVSNDEMETDASQWKKSAGFADLCNKHVRSSEAESSETIGSSGADGKSSTSTDKLLISHITKNNSQPSGPPAKKQVSFCLTDDTSNMVESTAYETNTADLTVSVPQSSQDDCSLARSKIHSAAPGVSVNLANLKFGRLNTVEKSHSYRLCLPSNNSDGLTVDCDASDSVQYLAESGSQSTVHFGSNINPTGAVHISLKSLQPDMIRLNSLLTENAVRVEVTTIQNGSCPCGHDDRGKPHCKAGVCESEYNTSSMDVLHPSFKPFMQHVEGNAWKANLKPWPFDVDVVQQPRPRRLSQEVIIVHKWWEPPVIPQDAAELAHSSQNPSPVGTPPTSMQPVADKAESNYVEGMVCWEEKAPFLDDGHQCQIRSRLDSEEWKVGESGKNELKLCVSPESEVSPHNNSSDNGASSESKTTESQASPQKKNLENQTNQVKNPGEASPQVKNPGGEASLQQVKISENVANPEGKEEKGNRKKLKKMLDSQQDCVNIRVNDVQKTLADIILSGVEQEADVDYEQSVGTVPNITKKDEDMQSSLESKENRQKEHSCSGQDKAEIPRTRKLASSNEETLTKKVLMEVSPQIGMRNGRKKSELKDHEFNFQQDRERKKKGGFQSQSPKKKINTTAKGTRRKEDVLHQIEFIPLSSGKIVSFETDVTSSSHHRDHADPTKFPEGDIDGKDLKISPNKYAERGHLLELRSSNSVAGNEGKLEGGVDESSGKGWSLTRTGFAFKNVPLVRCQSVGATSSRDFSDTDVDRPRSRCSSFSVGDSINIGKLSIQNADTASNGQIEKPLLSSNGLLFLEAQTQETCAVEEDCEDQQTEKKEAQLSLFGSVKVSPIKHHVDSSVDIALFSSGKTACTYAGENTIPVQCKTPVLPSQLWSPEKSLSCAPNQQNAMSSRSYNAFLGFNECSITLEDSNMSHSLENGRQRGEATKISNDTGTRFSGIRGENIEHPVTSTCSNIDTGISECGAKEDEDNSGSSDHKQTVFRRSLFGYPSHSVMSNGGLKSRFQARHFSLSSSTSLSSVPTSSLVSTESPSTSGSCTPLTYLFLPKSSEKAAVCSGVAPSRRYSLGFDVSTKSSDAMNYENSHLKICDDKGPEPENVSKPLVAPKTDERDSSPPVTKLVVPSLGSEDGEWKNTTTLQPPEGPASSHSAATVCSVLAQSREDGELCNSDGFSSTQSRHLEADSTPPQVVQCATSDDAQFADIREILREKTKRAADQEKPELETEPSQLGRLSKPTKTDTKTKATGGHQEKAAHQSVSKTSDRGCPDRGCPEKNYKRSKHQKLKSSLELPDLSTERGHPGKNGKKEETLPSAVLPKRRFPSEDSGLEACPPAKRACASSEPPASQHKDGPVLPSKPVDCPKYGVVSGPSNLVEQHPSSPIEQSLGTPISVSGSFDDEYVCVDGLEQTDQNSFVNDCLSLSDSDCQLTSCARTRIYKKLKVKVVKKSEDCSELRSGLQMSDKQEADVRDNDSEGDGSCGARESEVEAEKDGEVEEHPGEEHLECSDSGSEAGDSSDGEESNSDSEVSGAEHGNADGAEADKPTASDIHTSTSHNDAASGISRTKVSDTGHAEVLEREKSAQSNKDFPPLENFDPVTGSSCRELSEGECEDSNLSHPELSISVDTNVEGEKMCMTGNDKVPPPPTAPRGLACTEGTQLRPDWAIDCISLEPSEGISLLVGYKDASSLTFTDGRAFASVSQEKFRRSRHASTESQPESSWFKVNRDSESEHKSADTINRKYQFLDTRKGVSSQLDASSTRHTAREATQHTNREATQHTAREATLAGRSRRPTSTSFQVQSKSKHNFQDSRKSFPWERLSDTRSGSRDKHDMRGKDRGKLHQMISSLPKMQHKLFTSHRYGRKSPIRRSSAQTRSPVDIQPCLCCTGERGSLDRGSSHCDLQPHRDTSSQHHTYEGHRKKTKGCAHKSRHTSGDSAPYPRQSRCASGCGSDCFPSHPKPARSHEKDTRGHEDECPSRNCHGRIAHRGRERPDDQKSACACGAGNRHSCDRSRSRSPADNRASVCHRRGRCSSHDRFSHSRSRSRSPVRHGHR